MLTTPNYEKGLCTIDLDPKIAMKDYTIIQSNDSQRLNSVLFQARP